MGDLTRNFSRSEFACRCGCGLDSIDPDLVDILQHSRTAVGIPYPINSGCRCQVHNKRIGGAGNSAHLLYEDNLCHAADIGAKNWHDLYLLAWDLIRRFRRIEFGKLERFGKVELWIHVDNRRDLPQEVLILGIVE